MNSDLIFRGHHFYRTLRTLIRFGPLAALSGGVLAWAALRTPRVSQNDARAATMIIVFSVLGAVAFSVFVVSSVQIWHWWRNRTEILEISESGVAFGGRHWRWKSVARLELLTTASDPHRCYFRITLRTSRWRVYPFAADEELSATQLTNIVARLKDASAGATPPFEVYFVKL